MTQMPVRLSGLNRQNPPPVLVSALGLGDKLKWEMWGFALRGGMFRMYLTGICCLENPLVDIWTWGQCPEVGVNGGISCCIYSSLSVGETAGESTRHAALPHEPGDKLDHVKGTTARRLPLPLGLTLPAIALRR